MNKVIQVGNVANQIESSRDNPQRGRVYSTSGIAPTIYCYGGGNLEPHILVVKHVVSPKA